MRKKTPVFSDYLCDLHRFSPSHPAAPISWRMKIGDTYFHYSEFLFGFDSMEKLISWFLDQFHRLKRWEYHIVVYEVSCYFDEGVPVLISDDFQNIFHPDFAKEIDQISF